MKKVLKNFISLLMIAIFIYGVYSYYYEFIRWEDMLLVYLNALLVCLPFGICGGIDSEQENIKYSCTCNG